MYYKVMIVEFMVFHSCDVRTCSQSLCAFGINSKENIYMLYFSTATQPNYTDCQIRYIELSKNSVSGQYIPWCRPDGGYYWRQCYDSYCFCVDTSGREITKTRVHSSNGVPKCSENGKGCIIYNICIF